MSPKNPAAVALGRKGGEARARRLTAEQRAESARRASEARWAKVQEHLDTTIAELSKSTKAFARKAKALERKSAARWSKAKKAEKGKP